MFKRPTIFKTVALSIKTMIENLNTHNIFPTDFLRKCHFNHFSSSETHNFYTKTKEAMAGLRLVSSDFLHFF